MCIIFEIQVCIELRQKIVWAILKSNLRQQCINKTFAEESILNSDNSFVIYLDIFSRINHCIDKNQTSFLPSLLVFKLWLLVLEET